MENILNSDFLKNELRFYGLDNHDVALISRKDGVVVVRVSGSNGTAILKYFENFEFRREIHNYEILQKCGIPTITVLGKSDCSILLEDINASDTYRLGAKQDLSNPAIIEAIATWYKILHTNGRQYVQEYGPGMYDEMDYFTIENIESIRNRFELTESLGLKAVIDNYEKLRDRIDSAPKTLTYNDFYYTNLVVRKDASEAIMFDYNLLGKGLYISDIRNVIYWFSEENKRTFFSVYGEIDEGLMVLDRIYSPIVTLYYAMKRDIFLGWAKEAIDDLKFIPDFIAELHL